MNYFEELLNSYQLIKKRKFSVYTISEQAQEYANISAAIGVIQQIPIPKKGASQTAPLSTNPSIVAYNTAKGGGLRHTQGKGFPGTTSYDKSEITTKQIQNLMASNPETAKALDSFIGGQEVPETQDQSTQSQQPQQPEQPQQQEIPQQPLPVSEDPAVVAELEGMRKRIEVLRGDNESGSFFTTGISLVGAVLKRFFQPAVYSGSFASKLNQAKVIFRSGGELKSDALPPELAAKGTKTMNTVLDAMIKMKRGNFTVEDAETVKQLVKLNPSNTEVFLRFEEGSDDGLVVSWDRADTFYGILFSTYEQRSNEWLNDPQNKGINKEDIMIPRGSLSGGGKNYNNLRGTVAERFQALSNILIRGMRSEAACKAGLPAACTDAEYNKREALNMLKRVYEDNRDSLIPAFEIVDDYKHHEVPGTLATHELSEELSAALNFFKVEFPKKATEGVASPQDIQQYRIAADKIVDKMVKKLLMVDAQTVIRRSPTFVGETGQSSANSKKTDTTEVYDSRELGAAALGRMGYSPEEAAELLVPLPKVVEMYGGVQSYATLTGAPVEKIKSLLKNKRAHVLLNGIKTYTKESSITLGTGSVNQAYAKLSDPTNPSVQVFAQRLGVNSKKFAKTMKEFTDAHAALEELKGENFSASNSKSLMNSVKSKLADLGLAKSYVGLSGKSASAKGNALTRIQRNLLFDKFTDLNNKDSEAATDFMSMIIMSAAAADVNQQTEARFLNNATTYSLDHNKSIEEPLMMVKQKQARFERDDKSGTIKIVSNSGEELLVYSTEAGSNIVSGSVHLPFAQVKARAKKSSATKAVTASTDILINFLLGQKKLLEDLLTKYQ